jgi:hypothetical protein
MAALTGRFRPKIPPREHGSQNAMPEEPEHNSLISLVEREGLEPSTPAL